MKKGKCRCDLRGLLSRRPDEGMKARVRRIVGCGDACTWETEKARSGPNPSTKQVHRELRIPTSIPRMSDGEPRQSVVMKG